MAEAGGGAFRPLTPVTANCVGVGGTSSVQDENDNGSSPMGCSAAIWSAEMRGNFEYLIAYQSRGYEARLKVEGGRKGFPYRPSLGFRRVRQPATPPPTPHGLLANHIWSGGIFTLDGKGRLTLADTGRMSMERGASVLKFHAQNTSSLVSYPHQINVT